MVYLPDYEFGGSEDSKTAYEADVYEGWQRLKKEADHKLGVGT